MLEMVSTRRLIVIGMAKMKAGVKVIRLEL